MRLVGPGSIWLSKGYRSAHELLPQSLSVPLGLNEVKSMVLIGKTALQLQVYYIFGRRKPIQRA